MTSKAAPFTTAVITLACTLVIFADSARAWQSDNGDGTFKNPVFYADNADLDIIRVTNDFYMVSTTFVDSPGINVLHSKDLVNWELVSHCAANCRRQRQVFLPVSANNLSTFHRLLKLSFSENTHSQAKHN
jgi:beta-xylosidase